MTVNDRLRAATEAVTAFMVEPRPLQLPPEPAQTAQASGNHRKAGGWHTSWLIPLTAAAAVIAVAAVLVVVRNLPTHRQAGAPPTHQLVLPAVPGFYVALGQQRKDLSVPLVVGDIRTGKRIATISPPSHATFSGVTGAADDQTFVVDLTVYSQRDGHRISSHSWELLRLASGTAQSVQLSSLPIKAPLTQAEILGLALSPDARTLAVMFQPNALAYAPGSSPAPGPVTLQTYSLGTGGLLHSWTRPWNGGMVNVTPDSDNSAGLSWTSNSRTLAFTDPEAGGQPSLRALQVDSPGDNLLAASRNVFVLPSDSCYLPVLTPDGKAVLCGAGLTGPSCGKNSVGFDAYSTMSGGTGPSHLERVIYRYRGSCAQMWPSVVSAGSASTVIGVLRVISVVDHTAHVSVIGGVLTPGSFTPFRVALPSSVITSGGLAF
jgi:hypothetical protein